jgi:hypothetical protein
MTTREHETHGGEAEPPVLDLPAEEVAGAAQSRPADEPKPRFEEPSPNLRRLGWARAVMMAALLVMAFAIGAVGYRSFGERFWPSDRSLAMDGRLSALEATTHTLTSQITGIGAIVDAMKATQAGLPERIDQVASVANSSAERLKRFDQQLAESEQGLKSAREAIATLRSSSSGGTNAGVAPADLDALTKRVTALEEAMAALKSAPSPPTGENPETATLSQAVADLKAKVASGAPYDSEARTISRLVPGIPAIDRLLPYAASGLPTTESLAGEIASLAASLPGPAPDAQGADNGYWSQIDRFLASIVTVRTIGEADWKVVCAKAAADAKAGNLASALSLLDQNQAALPSSVAQWRDKARARAAADAAVEEVSAAVLKALAGPTGKS